MSRVLDTTALPLVSSHPAARRYEACGAVPAVVPAVLAPGAGVFVPGLGAGGAGAGFGDAGAVDAPAGGPFAACGGASGVVTTGVTVIFVTSPFTAAFWCWLRAG